jgi:predicted RNase H-like HicB family nuclease
MAGTVNIEYTVHIWTEGNQFIAHAMPLDVMSSGPSPDEARKGLDEAIHLFLVIAAGHGTLEDVLQEAGYELRLPENIISTIRKVVKHLLREFYFPSHFSCRSIEEMTY